MNAARRTLPGVTQTLRLEKAASTQDIAKGLAQQGAPAGTLVWADQQTAGRGRLERTWTSTAGGLYFSLIQRPSFAPSRLADLSVACSHAVARALRELAGIETAVKPPNDVLARAGKRSGKVCGILIEASGTSARLDWVVIGVGVNVNNKPPLKTACSLRSLTGQSWDVPAVLEAVLSEFTRALDSPNPL